MSTPRRSFSAARGSRILSPGHPSSRHLHRQTRCRQTGGSACTGKRRPETNRAYRLLMTQEQALAKIKVQRSNRPRPRRPPGR